MGFYINLPIGGFATLVFLYAFRPPRPKVNVKQQLKQFDYFGTFLLIAGSVILLLAITFGTSDFLGILLQLFLVLFWAQFYSLHLLYGILGFQRTSD